MISFPPPRLPKPVHTPAGGVFQPYWMIVGEWSSTGQVSAAERENVCRRLAAYAQRELRRALAKAILETDFHKIPRLLEPTFEPARQIANKLDLSLHTLDGLVRHTTGLSAREWWDVLRAAEPVVGLLVRLRQEFHDFFAAYVFDDAARPPACRRHPPSLAELQTALRRHRRARASTASARAWHAGFLNTRRLDRAALLHHRFTAGELELELLEEIHASWTWNAPARRLVPPAVPLRREAREGLPEIEGFGRDMDSFLKLRGRARDEDHLRWRRDSRRQKQDPLEGPDRYRAFKSLDDVRYGEPFCYLEHDPDTGDYLVVHLVRGRKTVENLGPVLPPEVAARFSDPDDDDDTTATDDTAVTEDTENKKEDTDSADRLLDPQAGSQEPEADGQPLAATDQNPTAGSLHPSCRRGATGRSQCDRADPPATANHSVQSATGGQKPSFPSSEFSVAYVASSPPSRTQCTDSAKSARSGNPRPATENEKEPAPHSFCKSASASPPAQPETLNSKPENLCSKPETVPSESQPDENEEPGPATARPCAHAAAGG
jgi:hypothetical protein